MRSFGSTCGGVLELSSGELEHSPVVQNGVNEDKNGATLCIWVIKVPPAPLSFVTPMKIQFQLGQMSPSAGLSLYPHKGHVPGQLTVLPIGLVLL